MLRLLLASAFVATVLPGQFPVGYRDAGIPNATSVGSPTLAVRIYYPATSSGANAPLRAQSGGYPVVVQLHGLGGRAANYADLGTTLARAGFVAVLNDTAQFNADLQLADALALYPSLRAENNRSTSVFRGALDMNRAGITGHSMGGGNTVRALAGNPGYRAGFCFAPWDGTIFGQGNSWTVTAPGVRVPLAILHGEGDTTVNWQSIGLRFFDRATSYTGLKAFVLLDRNADHSNIVRLPANPSNADRAAYARGMAMVTGWFDRHLRGGVTGLEPVVGGDVRRDALFKSIATAYRTPELWQSGMTRIGTGVGFHVGGEPGASGIYVSPGTKTIPLPYGVLKLDPVVILPLTTGTLGAPRLFSANLTIPNDPRLVGARAWLQAITAGSGTLQLTDVVPVRVQ